MVARKTRRMRVWGVRVVIIVAVVGVIATAAAGWEVSQTAFHAHYGDRPYNIRLLGFDGVSVELARSEAATIRGAFRLEWPGGWGRLGDVAGITAGTVRRPLGEIHAARPAAGTRGRIGPDYRGDPRSSLGLAFSEVAVPGPLGPMPAWLVAAALKPSAPWVIAIHGYGATRQDELGALPGLHAAGATVLIVSYRNDPGDPASNDHLNHLGASEWQDIDPAVAYALDHGASGVILFGESMGGTIALEEVRHGEHRSAVRALVLDAPALDFDRDARFGASQRGLPTPLAWWLIKSGELAMHWRAGMSFSDLDEISHAPQLNLPILLFQGDRDTTVAPSAADTFARARPDLITYVRVNGAEHVASRNVDPATYQDALATFLRRAGIA